MVIEFPRKFWEADHDWDLAGAAMLSGSALGVGPIVRSDGGGFWTASLNGIRFGDASYTRLWRALRTQSRNGVLPFTVHRRDDAFAPYPDGAGEVPPVPHDDGTMYSDGSGHYQPIISVSTLSAAARRAIFLTLDLAYCGPLQGGESFSILHTLAGWRMYEIGSVNQVGDRAVVQFSPPLREAVLAGTQVEFDRPRCQMRLANPAAMNLNVTTFPFSLASVKFVEAPW